MDWNGPTRRRGLHRPVIPWNIRLRSALSRRARTLGLSLVLLAALCAIWLPGESASTASGFAVTATRNLALGDPVGSEDLQIAQAAGPGALTREEAETLRDQLIGRDAAIPLSTGDHLSPGHAVSSKLTLHLPEDHVAAAVRVRDPESLRVLSPGQEVTVLTTPGAAGATGPAPPADPQDSGPSEHAEVSEGSGADIRALLLWIPPPPDQDAGWQSYSGGVQDLVLLAVSTADARLLAASGEPVTLLIRP